MNNRPAEKRAFAVFYANTVGRHGPMIERQDGPIPLVSLGDFHRGFDYVGKFEAYDLSDLFVSLQDGGGGLGHREEETEAEGVSANVMQELLVRKAGHTSLSVGDVAVDLTMGIVFVCLMIGWRQIEIVGMRKPVVA